MTDGSESQAGSRLMPKTTLGRLVHLAFWVALFYVLTYGIARLCEWLSP